jgi:peptide chain release factor 2
VRPWRELEGRVKELLELARLAEEEGEAALLDEIRAEAGKLAHRLEQLEFQQYFTGEYDASDALLSVHAGAGGTDSQDWAEMLLRMYLRWAQDHGFETEVLDLTPGEEAGIKSATVEVRGPYAYGYLKGEKGVHRLVRLSPFDAAHRRHTSFALVEVLPVVERDVRVEIRPEDLKIDRFRASGPGGQNVQKVSTAVRVTHIPTGIVVACQSERSQAQNLENALKILKAKLLELELKRKEEEIARLRGERVSAEWGNQIRSYVLHPYTLVKDHRTGHETSQADRVLDGELDDFIREYLRWSLAGARAAAGVGDGGERQ